MGLKVTVQIDTTVPSGGRIRVVNQSVTGPAGAPGTNGTNGVGVPTGGTTGQALTKASNTNYDTTWTTIQSGIPATLLDAKGDLIVASAADTAARLAVGTNGHVLTADSAATNGVKWAAPSGVELPSTTVTSTTYAPNGWGATSTVTTWALTLNTIYYQPITFQAGWTMSSVAIQVTTQAAAGGKAIVAIYNADALWQPTSLVAQTAEFATDSTGTKTASITASGSAGRFLLAINTNASVTVRVRYGTSPIGSVNLNSAGDGFQVARRVSGTYTTTWPSTGTAWTTVSTNASDFQIVYTVVAA